jgi:hypothetical protein
MNNGFETHLLSDPRLRGSTPYASSGAIPIGSLAKLTFEVNADRRSP